MPDRWFAHSLPDCADTTRWQPLAEHLKNVAAQAAARGEKFDAGRAALLAGLLHDLGKYTREFQDRLKGGPRVDHSTAGAREIVQLGLRPDDKCIAEIIAHAIAGHHAGLPDSVGNETSLAERQKRQLPALDPVWRAEIAPTADGLTPDFLLQCANKKRLPYQLAFFGRMLFSCLVDADFRDTEDFYARANGQTVDRNWPRLPEHVDDYLGRFDNHMANKRRDAPDTPVNRLRGEILAHVRARATSERGLFTLSVPTGGGKTLASLAFALEHAKRHRLERIIYAIPFTSIIDQTAAIFRDVLGPVIN